MATTVDSRPETASLIGSDKISGKVAYAVISFGGFLGMGEDYYPMPWASLKYDTNLGGYRVGVTEDQLKGAPKYNRNTEWDWSDRNRDKDVYDYYRAQLWYCRGGGSWANVSPPRAIGEPSRDGAISAIARPERLVVRTPP